jgi:hypothetical protein
MQADEVGQPVWNSHEPWMSGGAPARAQSVKPRLAK